MHGSSVIRARLPGVIERQKRTVIHAGEVPNDFGCRITQTGRPDGAII